MQIIPNSAYPIYLIEADEVPDWNILFNLEKYSQVFILVDEHTKESCLPLLQSMQVSFSLLQISSGEDHKNLDTCSFLWSQLIAHKADRNSVIINLGGGVIGDMGGFVASTFKRGIRFIQVPTTLLSMVDASVGGKLGIDHEGLKNVVGVFQNPDAIIVHPAFLRTLPPEQLRSGMAEVYKHGLIADAAYWKYLSKEDFVHIKDWTTLISRSIHIKKNVVESDPTEKGVRKILNFGHTIGHAIETLSLVKGNKAFLHGEAIALGMMAESWLSHQLTGLPEIEMQEICNVLRKTYPELRIHATDIPDYLSLMQHDKKNENGQVLCSLLSQTGDCRFNLVVGEADMVQALQYLAGL